MSSGTDRAPAVLEESRRANSTPTVVSHMWARIAARRRFASVWIAAAVLYGILIIVSPGFASVQQALTLSQVATFLGIVAIGQTIVMLVGGIDLSVGGTVVLSNIVAAGVMDGDPGNLPIGLAAVALIGITVGLANGLLITAVGITPLIATLSVGMGLTGIAFLYGGGTVKGSIPENFADLVQGHVGPIPSLTVVWIGLVVLGVFLTRLTGFGRRLHLVGSSELAALVDGISTSRIRVAAYVLSAVFASVAGLLVVAYAGQASYGVGETYVLGSVAAAAVGGTLLTGGVGSVLAAAGGAYLLTIIESLTAVAHVSYGFGVMVQGIIILAAVFLYGRGKT